MVKACAVTNAFGTCLGAAVCDPALGFVECTARVPAEEVCNGLDDNCDGQVDEGQVPTVCSRTNEHGTCVGIETCQGAAGRVCGAREPAEEVCNGLDDNCDGQVDEGFVDDAGRYVTVAHCGACGVDCRDRFSHAEEVTCDASGETPECRVVSCEPGFVLLNDTTCVSEDATLCNPCGADAECFGEGSRCLQVSPTEPRTFCGRDCSGASGLGTACPAGYACEEVEGGPPQCLPLSGSCDCTASNAGQVKACIQQNELGTCFGQEVCDPALGWTGCTARVPVPEVCDGVDSDCNGLIDDGIVTGEPCERDNEHGTCEGVTFCAGAGGIQCTAPVPAPEVCNGRDDDCNGVIDDGFAVDVGGTLKYSLSADHCGACGRVCPAVAHGEVFCDGAPAFPECRVASCDEGFYVHLGVTCLPVPSGTSCAPCEADQDCVAPGDVCVDEGEAGSFCAWDCGAGSVHHNAAAPCTGELGAQGCCPAGTTCEDGGEGRRLCRPVSGTCLCVEDGAVTSCSRDNAWGTCFGTQTCALGDAPGLSTCSAAEPGPEVCDGTDNDCDGLVDAADPSLDVTSTPTGGPTCDNGPGCQGVWECVGAAWRCSAPEATEEVCDGRDNDCDGVVDNGFRDPDTGQYLLAEHCGGCGFDCAQILTNSTAVTCELAAGVPTCRALACAEGFYPFAGGQACLALPDNLCQSCITDAECLVPSSRCVDLGQERACGRSCAASSPYGPECPAGYGCEDVGGGALQCVPITGTCRCDEELLGVQRACPVGECTGLQTCEARDGGLFGFTECSAVGLIPEVCDGIDNDCNGLTDEGFLVDGLYVTDEHCGGCGNDCLLRWSVEVHQAFGACSGAPEPRCVIAACLVEDDGPITWEWVDTNGLEADGCECRRELGNLDVDPPELDFGGYPGPAAIYEDANCDGVDGVIERALFVRAGSVAGSGTLEAPYGTLAEALAAWPSADKEYILVAAGNYPENVALIPGVQLHGGYAPDFKSRNIATFETRILGREPESPEQSVPPGTIHAAGITGEETIVSGFVIRGYDATLLPLTPGSPGTTSYAVYAVDSDASLRLLNNRILGGRGGDGAPGTFGANGFGATSPGGGVLAGGAGTTVESGNSACTGTTCPAGSQRAGGSAGVNPQCPVASGIPGGSAACPIYNAPSWTPPDPAKDGAPGYTWTRDALGNDSNCGSHLTEAGFPGAIEKMDGYAGAAGADGPAGPQGAGCASADGQLVGGLWTNVPGQIGGGGGHGARGGAGAPSGGVDTASAANMPDGVGANSVYRHKLGAGGGGAGAGGCGGAGGVGGGSGGASVAVFLAWTGPAPAAGPPELRANIITRGLGGGGGVGGYGGAGGAGGGGGVGGTSSNFWVGFRAGDGGRGGFGGEGGGGGGGCGGASFGVAIYGGDPAWGLDPASVNAFPVSDALATGGTGGAAGPSGAQNPSAQGAPGASRNVHQP